MLGHYVLRDGTPVEEPNVIKWGQWFENAGETRVVRQSTVGGPSGIMVSTVFLGIDHNFSFQGPPLLFETLVFGGPLDGDMRRYTTREAAESGHKEMLSLVRAEWSLSNIGVRSYDH